MQQVECPHCGSIFTIKLIEIECERVLFNYYCEDCEMYFYYDNQEGDENE